MPRRTTTAGPGRPPRRLRRQGSPVGSAGGTRCPAAAHPARLRHPGVVARRPARRLPAWFPRAADGAGSLRATPIGVQSSGSSALLTGSRAPGASPATPNENSGKTDLLPGAQAAAKSAHPALAENSSSDTSPPLSHKPDQDRQSDGRDVQIVHGCAAPGRPTARPPPGRRSCGQA